MDLQTIINIAAGIVTLLGGWLFKMITGHLDEIKENHSSLAEKYYYDLDKIKEKHSELALGLTDRYVSKDDFKIFSERMNDRFDRLEAKLDQLKR